MTHVNEHEGRVLGVDSCTLRGLQPEGSSPGYSVGLIQEVLVGYGKGEANDSLVLVEEVVDLR